MERTSGPFKGLRFAVAAFVISLFLFLAVVGGGTLLIITRSNDNARFAEQIRDGLVASCEQNGNPTREAVQGLLEEQIRTAQSPIIDSLFPSFPPAELEALINARIRANQNRLEEVRPVDCSRLYPPNP